MKRKIKFRVFVENQFFFWGFINNQFVGLPNVSGLSQTEVMETSQQFTGLSDKLGKEIYEGDIVNVYDDIGAEKTMGEKFDRYTVKGQDFAFMGFLEDMCGQKKCEVIGNVWENQSLI
jgi:hypothetical protein